MDVSALVLRRDISHISLFNAGYSYIHNYPLETWSICFWDKAIY